MDKLKQCIKYIQNLFISKNKQKIKLCRKEAIGRITQGVCSIPDDTIMSDLEISNIYIDDSD